MALTPQAITEAAMAGLDPLVKAIGIPDENPKKPQSLLEALDDLSYKGMKIVQELAALRAAAERIADALESRR